MICFSEIYVTLETGKQATNVGKKINKKKKKPRKDLHELSHILLRSCSDFAIDAVAALALRLRLNLEKCCGVAEMSSCVPNPMIIYRKRRILKWPNKVHNLTALLCRPNNNNNNHNNSNNNKHFVAYLFA